MLLEYKIIRTFKRLLLEIFSATMMRVGMTSAECILLSWFGLDWDVEGWLSGFLFYILFWNNLTFTESCKEVLRPATPPSPRFPNFALFPLPSPFPLLLLFWTIWDQAVNLMCHHSYVHVSPAEKHCPVHPRCDHRHQEIDCDTTLPSKPETPFNPTNSLKSVTISFLVQNSVQDHALYLVSFNMKVTAFLCLLYPWQS